jgi:UDP-glucose 4-epimerase
VTRVTLAEHEDVAKYFRDKRVLVTGGTGSFGHHIVKTLLDLDVPRIVILSRDEKKQYDMRDEYAGDPRLHFVIGDVRDYETLQQAFRGVDVVYHAAALKQIPICEHHPVEAVRTNILGAENVRRAALANHVETVVSLSTDKAVKPVNAMGMTKALGEKILLNQANIGNGTRFMCVRYGNVLGSRGSVVPLFRNRIDQNRPVPVTDPEMTRFLLTLSEAIDLVFHATLRGESGHLYVRKMPACTVMVLADVMTRALTGRADYPIECVGVRPGEKIHEVLVSEEEMGRAVESATYYDVMPTAAPRAHGRPRLFEYRSDNTERLDADRVLQLLRSECWV